MKEWGTISSFRPEFTVKVTANLAFMLSCSGFNTKKTHTNIPHLGSQSVWLRRLTHELYIVCSEYLEYVQHTKEYSQHIQALIHGNYLGL